MKKTLLTFVLICNLGHVFASDVEAENLSRVHVDAEPLSPRSATTVRYLNRLPKPKLARACAQVMPVGLPPTLSIEGENQNSLATMVFELLLDKGLLNLRALDPAILKEIARRVLTDGFERLVHVHSGVAVLEQLDPNLVSQVKERSRVIYYPGEGYGRVLSEANLENLANYSPVGLAIAAEEARIRSVESAVAAMGAAIKPKPIGGRTVDGGEPMGRSDSF